MSDFKNIDTLDADCTDLNEAIKTINWAVGSWKDLVGPIEDMEA